VSVTLVVAALQGKAERYIAAGVNEGFSRLKADENTKNKFENIDNIEVFDYPGDCGRIVMGRLAASLIALRKFPDG